MSTATSRQVPLGRSSRGFSFIEVLVVMGIIAVLVAGGLVVLGMVVDRQRVFQTEHSVQQAALLVEDWHRSFERYPPSSMTDLSRLPGGASIKAEAPNDANEGVEAVYQSLLWPGFSGTPAWRKEQLGNTDGDHLERPVNALGTTALHEVIDAYGNPLVYFNSGEYARFAESGARYVRGEEDVEVRPHRAEGDTFARPLSFQVFSMGPDGLPNTSDDICHWR
jgi:prepilin-type N-terminal cleavage/methylation domain-containing protein